jgi:hemolysin-activating ACP:hemolysin acyltransferase
MTAPSRLQLVTFSDPAVALGIAVRLTMQYPVFAKLPFGEWAEVLAAQSMRGHQAFVVDDAREVRGFFGYALASRVDAEAWASGTRQLRSDECLTGDCLILNAWVSADRTTLGFMIRAFRRLGQPKQALYFKRLYSNGTVRASCIANNKIVARHVYRDHEALC